MKNGLNVRTQMDANNIPKDHRIYLYKKDSRGEVVGIYNNVKEIASNESIYNKNFDRRSIDKCLHGKNKYFTSLHHQCKVRPVIRKVM